MDPLEFAVKIAREAGALLLELVDTPLEIGHKATSVDLVTVADRRSERLIVDALREAFPHSSILGEEGGAYAGSSTERWIVDPLDGTTNYAHGYSVYCVSIGYERDGVLEAGVVYAPKLKECFAARRGGGATLNGLPIRVSSVPSVARALVCTGFNPARYDRNGPFFAALSNLAQGVRRDGAAALDLAYVAAGRFDAFWEWDLKPWDKAAGALIVAEAGGAVSAIDGGPLDIDRGSILVSNGAVHDEMVRVLRATGVPPP